MQLSMLKRTEAAAILSHVAASSLQLTVVFHFQGYPARAMDDSGGIDITAYE